jgi:hypothetical protein
MKKTSKHILLLAFMLGASLGLAACGQRVSPQPPEGKTVPSSQY